jgi:type I restriction enzyme S subunit
MNEGSLIWEQKRLKHVACHIVVKKTPTDGEITISPENVESGTGRILSFFSDYKSDGHEFIAGDILFNKLRVYLQKVLLTSYSGVSLGEMIVLRPTTNVYPNFLYWFLSSSIFIDRVNSLAQGVNLPRPPVEGILNQQVYLPPLDEQRLISRYLDKKTQQINTLIEKIEKKIELLKEQRTSLINHYVTKGLDPNVEMKDSGVEWIGKIPKHWDLKKLSHVTDSIGSGTTPKADNDDYYEDGSINWLVTGDLNDGDVFATTRKVTALALREHSALKIYPPNSLLIAMYGATIGKLGILHIPSTVNQATCVMLFTKSQDVSFWFYVLLGNRQYITSLGYGGGQPNISQDIIRNLRFPAPPSLMEQTSISQALKSKTESIDAVLDLEERKLGLISEYRQSLISSVVTGKVRVTEDMV